MNSLPVAMVQFDDGRGGQAMYIGGSFTNAGGRPARQVVRWWPQTDEWEDVGNWGTNPISPVAVNRLRVLDSGTGRSLFAATDRGVQKWSGNQWSSVGVFFRTVWDIAVVPANGQLRLVAATDIGMYCFDGALWMPMGLGIDTRALAWFSPPGFNTPQLIALAAGSAYLWDGAGWAPLPVTAGRPWSDSRGLLSFDDDGPGGPSLIAFAGHGGVGGSVFRWRASVWERLASPMFCCTTDAVHSFDLGTGAGPRLYAGGSGFLHEWTGTAWVPALANSMMVSFLATFQATPGSRPVLIIGGALTGDWATGRGVGRVNSCLRCPADVDNSGTSGVQDLLAYLQLFFASDPAADFDSTPGVDLDDLFAFLAAWQAGCV